MSLSLIDATEQVLGNITNAVVVKPTGTADGDLLVVSLAGWRPGARVITPPVGWTRVETQITPQYASNDKMDVFWKIASSEGANWTFVYDAATWVAYVCGSYRSSEAGDWVLDMSAKELGPTNGAYTTHTLTALAPVTPIADCADSVYIECMVLSSGETGDYASNNATFTLASQIADGNVNIQQEQLFKQRTTDATETPVVTTAHNSNGHGSIGMIFNIAGPTAEPPVADVAPVITGSANQGSTLTVSTPGTYTGDPIDTTTYKWQRDGVDIGGATGVTYASVSADIGHAVRAVETATNAGGSASQNSNAITIVTNPWTDTILPAKTIVIAGVTRTLSPAVYTSERIVLGIAHHASARSQAKLDDAKAAFDALL